MTRVHAKKGDVVNCPPQIVLGQTISEGGQAYVVAVKQQKFGNVTKQINVVQNKRGQRVEYFDSDCGLVREAK